MMLMLGQIASVGAILPKPQIGTHGLEYVKVLMGTREETVLDGDYPSNPRPSRHHQYLGGGGEGLPTRWPKAASCHLILLSIRKAQWSIFWLEQMPETSERH